MRADRASNKAFTAARVQGCNLWGCDDDDKDIRIGVADELPVHYRGGVGKSNRGGGLGGVGNLRS